MTGLTMNHLLFCHLHLELEFQFWRLGVARRGGGPGHISPGKLYGWAGRKLGSSCQHAKQRLPANATQSEEGLN